MRSGSDEVEAGPGGRDGPGRPAAPAHGGPGAGPPRRCRTVVLVQRTSRADGPCRPLRSDARGSGVDLLGLCPRTSAAMQKRPSQRR
ncbi:hypothetical protein FSY75_32780 [Streptomyces sp. TR1341]|nr:hypothetical protein [Streptomyces sp. TR1341]